ncbi:Phytoene synthase [Tepidimonas thermarum]|uniref:Phytoene synthase n=1 Tax=Tepidimonas thermarum TaxID=335431 RepID=A0A554WZQ3_9BURK|nr:presqualene diphosphate synthase HpnD [Tepidimonas thermarum]TSE29072.1 Phytoene synthase [Tepidimonas thermarum]
MTPTTALAQAQAYAQERAAASGSSFYYAFLFLPPQRRAAITAFYAFCREIDDVVDEVRDPGVAHAKLDWWRQQVVRTFGGQVPPEHPALIALQPHIGPFGLSAEPLLHIIDGCAMDLQQSRYLDFAGLQRYCHLVAGVVGEVAARIFGQTQAQTTAYAHRLGLAFQLTNIIRDVGEDALRGRIYLPIDELQRFDVRAHELLKRGVGAGPDFGHRFAALMRFQIERALAIYDEAIALLPAADRRTQKPGLMMASIYRTLLREIAPDPALVLTRRVGLTPLRKFWLAWKVQALGRL